MNYCYVTTEALTTETIFLTTTVSDNV